MNLYSDIQKGPFFIAGPCVIESESLVLEVATHIRKLADRFQVPFIFKASFDKANRTSLKAFRGPGLEEGLRILAKVKAETGLPLLTDIHESHQAAPAGEVIDILQIPAFLCRQTDLLVAAAKTGRIVNIKKAQFLGGHDMRYPCEKVTESGNPQVILTERGNIYGYNNLVVDFRNLPLMKEFGFPVVMDCTHSVQKPGGQGGSSGGDSKYVESMALAAKAFGADGYFFETHPDPSKALSDGPNMVPLAQFGDLIAKILS